VADGAAGLEAQVTGVTDDQAQFALGRRATLALPVRAQVALTAGEEPDCSQGCGDTVVGPRLEPAGHVVLARPPTGEGHRGAGGGIVGSEPPRQLQRAQCRQHEVAHDDARV